MSMSNRETFIAGLRELATFLEGHPDVPVPPYGHQFDVFVESKEDLAPVARAATWEKRYLGGYFALVHTCPGPIEYHVNIERGRVCRRMVTGQVWVPAVPAQIVDQVEWVCDDVSLLDADAH
jgi:hypothetical protein